LAPISISAIPMSASFSTDILLRFHRFFPAALLGKDVH
jgi:hypothetical protein